MEDYDYLSMWNEMRVNLEFDGGRGCFIVER